MGWGGGDIALVDPSELRLLEPDRAAARVVLGTALFVAAGLLVSCVSFVLAEDLSLPASLVLLIPVVPMALAAWLLYARVGLWVLDLARRTRSGHERNDEPSEN